jgi:hypothetical protein
MYVTPPTEVKETRRRRLLIVGKSGSRKTTSLLTSPRPIAVINYPGELGWDTIPDGDADVYKRVWADDVGKAQDALKVVKAIEEEALSVIASGKYRSIWFEGLHHFTFLALDFVTDGAYLRGKDFEPRLYGLGYRMVFDHLTRMSNTNVPVVGWTCWAELKAERAKRQGEKAEDVPKKVLAALPGQLPHQIMGRFSVTLYQSLKPRKDKAGMTQKNERGEVIYDSVWQTRQAGDVLCAGLKGPAAVVERIPLLIPATYQALEAAWVKAEREANQ